MMAAQVVWTDGRQTLEKSRIESTSKAEVADSVLSKTIA